MHIHNSLRLAGLAGAASVAMLAACGGGASASNDNIPQLGPATGATIASCTGLATGFSVTIPRQSRGLSIL